MSRPASGLGRGLSALLGEQAAKPATDEPSNGERGVREIEIARIRPNPNQPRRIFDEAGIDELADSIAQRGVIQPILVRAQGDDFEIIAGERRWRAAQRARLHSIPALVRESDDATTSELALIENIQRADLNAIEEAEGYRQLMDTHGRSQDDVARLVHKSRSHVANLLRLLSLPDVVKQSLLRGDITMGHARAVATAADPEGLTRQIIEGELSVRQAESLAKRTKPDNARAPRTARGAAADPDITALERQLGDMLGLKVKVADKGGSGSVSLQYSNLEQLDLICQRLSAEAI